MRRYYLCNTEKNYFRLVYKDEDVKNGDENSANQGMDSYLLFIEVNMIWNISFGLQIYEWVKLCYSRHI